MRRAGTIVSSADLRPLDAVPVAADVAATPHVVAIAVNSTTIAVRFDDVRAAELFRRRYRAMLSARDAEESTVCLRRGPDYHFLRSDGRSRVWRGEVLHPSTIAFFADAVAVNGYFASRRDVVSVHAAGIVANGRAALVSGVSTAGKTTTAVAALLLGADLLSDERCVLHDGGVQAFPRAISLRPGGCALLAAPAAGRGGLLAREVLRRARRGEGWPDLGLADIGRTVPAPAPLGAIVLLGGRGERARLEPLAPDAALAELAPAMLSGAEGWERAVLVRRLTRGVPAFRLHLGTPEASAELVVSALRPSTVAA